MKNLRLLGRAVVFLVGLALVVGMLSFVVAMLNHIVRGDDRGLAVMVLILQGFIWVPVLVFGLMLMGGGRLLKAVRKPKQFECLVCSQSIPSLSLFCPLCGSEDHRATNCRSCGAPRQAHNRFCRNCGASAV